MIDIKDIRKSYKTGGFVQRALDGVSITFRDSEFVAVLGPSGSGKTTFLNILGGFDHADSGDIVVNGVSTKDYSDKDWDTYRNHRIGFIFQSYNLIPHQTVLGNVELALTLAGVGRAERRARALAALERVGLADHVNKRPSQLSGGQMQRVAIARALVNNPEIVLADEPTGALDTETGVQVMNILAEVARDRLVIMVTHNPQLAHDYATRIVSIKDGRIVDDSHPIALGEAAAATGALAAGPAPAAGNELAASATAEPAATPAAAAPRTPKKRSSMSLLTALSLSANNLMTKKGRTIMTAFAGSIGIIGIAAILALSNGTRGYIARVEEDTLSSYPLTIARQSYDAMSLLGGNSGMSGNSGMGGGTTSSTGDSTASAITDTSTPIPEATTLKDRFASVKSNDLTSFKAFLDSGGDGMMEEVNTLQYDYGTTPLVFCAANDASGTATDPGAAPVQLSPNAMSSSTSSGSAAMSETSWQNSGSSAFSEMLDDQDLLDAQYDVVAGRWANAADEAVLVLSSDGKISDYTLYSIGVLDPNELNDLVSESSSASGAVEVPETDVSFSYDDALNTSFKVLSPAETYRKNDETGGWTNLSDDADFMSQQVSNGLDLRIVGVVKPTGTSDASALSEGVTYTAALTRELMQRSASSEIVQQQLAQPDVDVFTGKTFDELKSESEQGLDLSNLITVDESAIKDAFTLDSSKLGAGLDVSGLDVAGLDLGDMSIDLSGVTSDIDMESIVAGAPAPDFSGILDDLADDSPLSPEETEQVLKLGGQLVQGFLDYLVQTGADLHPGDEDFPSTLLALFQAYVQTPEATAILDQVEQVAGPAVRERLQQEASDYVSNSLAPYLQGAFQSLAKQVGEQIGSAVSSQIQSQLAAAMSEAMGQLSGQLSSQLATNLQSALSVDTSAFANAIHFNMTAEDLSSLITNYANASRLTYDNNLSTLGYADEANPQSIKIYPKNFEAKEQVLSHIDAYNQQMRDAGEDDKAISYTDYVGIIVSSVTKIVDMISLVLIAFVSISLVVSSIMIGIITYISVLERKKEIGVLRAMGASKLNIASVFNAETFIEGLISGVFAIIVVVIASFPVNAWVLATYDVPNIMSLPPLDAMTLIAISVLLTLVAGIIPSASASRRDPVEALRSE